MGMIFAVVCAAMLGAGTPSGRGARVEEPTDGVRLAVIAPESLRGALRPYLTFKRERLTVVDVALEDVLRSSPGVDDAERLKVWLFEAWKAGRITHVLLVGDADVMPVRYMVLDRVTPEAFDYAFYPSDMYYADVAKPDGSFDDWNGRKDGFHARYFGEVRGEKNKSDPINYDGVDYRPELAVGRWPVSSADEVSIVAAKTMAAERHVGDLRAGFVMAGGWVDARPAFDRLGRALPAGWLWSRCYYAGDGGEPGPSPADLRHVIELLNGRASLIVHAGHGNDDVWEGCLSVGDLVRVHNESAPAVMISAGCSTAPFSTLPPYEPYEDADGHEHGGTNAGEVFTEPRPPPSCYARGRYNRTGLGEQLLRAGPGGAAAYIGCTTGSQPCALTLEEGFVGTLASLGRPRVGDCWAGALRHYYDREHLATITPTPDWYPASVFFQGMKFILFGDPTLPLPSVSWDRVAGGFGPVDEQHAWP